MGSARSCHQVHCHLTIKFNRFRKVNIKVYSVYYLRLEATYGPKVPKKAWMVGIKWDIQFFSTMSTLRIDHLHTLRSDLEDIT